MSTSDNILDYSDDGDDDEVQVIIAALQKRKEKMAKLKKTVRERAGKIQKQLNQDSENQDPKLTASVERMATLTSQLHKIQERHENLPPVACDVSKEDQEEASVAKQNLRKAGESAKAEVQRILANVEKKTRKAMFLLQSEAVRSRDPEISAAFEALGLELERANRLVRTDY